MVFPNQRHTTQTPIKAWGHFTLKSLQRIDVLGTILLLGASVLIITPLQQTADGASFRSALVLPSIDLLRLDVDRILALVLVHRAEERASRTCISLAFCHWPYRYGDDSVCTATSPNTPFNV
jgi:hypothetical protein